MVTLSTTWVGSGGVSAPATTTAPKVKDAMRNGSANKRFRDTDRFIVPLLSRLPITLPAGSAFVVRGEKVLKIRPTGADGTSQYDLSQHAEWPSMRNLPRSVVIRTAVLIVGTLRP